MTPFSNSSPLARSPPGSLGRLAELTAQLCAVQQALAPRTTPRRVVLAADHGVVAEGVTTWPSEVTRLMTQTITNDTAASSVLVAATEAGCFIRGRLRPTGETCHPQSMLPQVAENTAADLRRHDTTMSRPRGDERGLNGFDVLIGTSVDVTDARKRFQATKCRPFNTKPS